MNGVDFAGPNVASLARRWWVPVVRGVAAILFGFIALFWPQIGLLTLVMLWGAYAFVDGVFNLAHAARAGRVGQRWGWFVFEGIVSIAAASVAFFYPGLTAFVLLLTVAAWSVVTGIAAVAAAVRLRKQVEGEWLLAASGAISIAFGVLLVMFPGAGTLALVWMIGIYSIVFGGLLIALGIRLRRWQEGTARPVPVGGATARL